MIGKLPGRSQVEITAGYVHPARKSAFRIADSIAVGIPREIVLSPIVFERAGIGEAYG